MSSSTTLSLLTRRLVVALAGPAPPTRKKTSWIDVGSAGSLACAQCHGEDGRGRVQPTINGEDHGQAEREREDQPLDRLGDHEPRSRQPDG